jgi:hypothetical protein
MKFVVYQVWTRHEVVDADSYESALQMAEPGALHGQAMTDAGYSLCNWHAVQVEQQTEQDELAARVEAGGVPI